MPSVINMALMRRLVSKQSLKPSSVEKDATRPHGGGSFGPCTRQERITSHMTSYPMLNQCKVSVCVGGYVVDFLGVLH